MTLLASARSSGVAESKSPWIDRVCRHTKIVCTLGPASCQPQQIRRLIRAGANVFRLNFSHADHEWHFKALTAVRQQADELGKPVAVIAQTIKGKGVSFMEDDNNWHYRIPTAEEVRSAHLELGLI